MPESFFDKDFRLEELERCGDRLTKLNELIPWENFRPELEILRKGEEERKSPAGRMAFDVVLMFKIMILQSLYNQIRIAGAKVKIGLRNLAYNLDRFASFMEGKRIEELLKA